MKFFRESSWGVVLFWFLRFGGKGSIKNWMARARIKKDQKLLLFVRLMVGDTRDLQPASDAGGNMWELGAGLWL
jgi:hypothetical protein